MIQLLQVAICLNCASEATFEWFGTFIGGPLEKKTVFLISVSHCSFCNLVNAIVGNSYIIWW